jgi:hypothetical protein
MVQEIARVPYAANTGKEREDIVFARNVGIQSIISQGSLASQ